ncbi:MAG: hypothetical protein H2058_17455 [Muricauda sp.]|nr:hypothetical protein [Allomuricauda sp.]MBA4747030.1 hypothetical protein [Allomuricauda sp.]
MSYNSYFGYIESLGGNGWLRVKLNDGFIWPLPEFLKVLVTKSGDREEFEILEGRFNGKKATVKKKGWRWDQWDWDMSFFEDDIREGHPHRGAAEMRFYIKSKKLEIDGLGEFYAKTQEDNPPPLGKYDIEIPYEPHPGGDYYTGQSTYAKTWFRIGHSGDRFLHCGNVSAGCITVKDIHRWDEIYKHLIISRKDFDSIGTVEIIDK